MFGYCGRGRVQCCQVLAKVLQNQTEEGDARFLQLEWWFGGVDTITSMVGLAYTGLSKS